jgi:hypothetical protein
MARRDAGATGRLLARIPRPLQPVIGSAVLVGAVRAVDFVFKRVTGNPPPIGVDEQASDGAAASRVVRDRLIYALMLGGALRLAKRAGLRDTKTTRREDDLRAS